MTKDQAHEAFQYLQAIIRKGRLVILVRDIRTGRIISTKKEEQK